jgi:hypothetical protein
LVGSEMGLEEEAEGEDGAEKEGERCNERHGVRVVWGAVWRESLEDTDGF